MAANDILVESTGQPVITGGDFNVGDSEPQHIEHLLVAYPGSYFYHPLTGIGAPAWKNARVGLASIEATCKLQLKADGWTNEKVVLDGQNITIGAERNDG